jgi:hypothetical protein
MTDSAPEFWTLSIQTPIGPQASVATFIRAGQALSGRVEGKLGGEEIAEGKIDGDTLSWVNDVKKPAKIKLTFEVTVAGDKLAGKVKMGLFGTFDVRGERARA